MKTPWKIPVSRVRLALEDTGPATFEENDTSFCYAMRDKVWVHGPGKEPWEVSVVKGDSEQRGSAGGVLAPENKTSSEPGSETESGSETRVGEVGPDCCVSEQPS